MKCIGETCGSYNTDYFYPTCLETNCRINKGAKCKLLEKVKEVRDDLIRRCTLFEELLDMGCNESFDKLIDRIDEAK